MKPTVWEIWEGRERRGLFLAHYSISTGPLFGKGGPHPMPFTSQKDGRVEIPSLSTQNPGFEGAKGSRKEGCKVCVQPYGDTSPVTCFLM